MVHQHVLVLTISLPLILVAIIASVFEFGLSFVFGYFSIAGAVLIMIILTFLPLVVCVIVAALLMILSKLNLVGTDGDWGALDLIKSVYSDIFSDISVILYCRKKLERPKMFFDHQTPRKLDTFMFLEKSNIKNFWSLLKT